MLTRLRVSGFKNLVDVDVRFGPFTCIAGPNGVGKSNLFDAILFLRDLADKPFVEAAANVRGGEDSTLLFTPGREQMTLIAELLIPQSGVDEFGQHTNAASTLLEYSVTLALVDAQDGLGKRIALRHERLDYFTKREARRRLAFACSKSWLDSVLVQSRRGSAYISTDSDSARVKRHQDHEVLPSKASASGRALEHDLATLPRTVLSSARNAQENRTAVLARREMQSWRVLQLEPSAMRRPDDFRAQDHIAHDGAHLAATLHRLISGKPITTGVHEGANGDRSDVLARLANRLSELVSGVRSVRVERDDERRLVKILLEEAGGAQWPAASLSDGTLRFLALALLEEDPRETGVICMEEPENGIHPARLDAMLSLLRDIAVDTEYAIGEDNPLRQIIINTHSPAVAGLVPEADLLFAEPVEIRSSMPSELLDDDQTRASVAFRPIEGTWRSQCDGAQGPVAPGEVLSYLSPTVVEPDPGRGAPARRQRSVREYVHDQLALDLDGRDAADEAK